MSLNQYPVSGRPSSAVALEMFGNDAEKTDGEVSRITCLLEERVAVSRHENFPWKLILLALYLDGRPAM